MTQILFLLLFHITSLYTFECVDVGFFSSLILKYFLQVSWDKNLYFLILYLHSYSSAFNPVQNSAFHMIGSTPFQLGLGLGENYNGYDLLFCIVFFSILFLFFFFFVFNYLYIGLGTYFYLLTSSLEKHGQRLSSERYWRWTHVVPGKK